MFFSVLFLVSMGGRSLVGRAGWKSSFCVRVWKEKKKKKKKRGVPIAWQMGNYQKRRTWDSIRRRRRTEEEGNYYYCYDDDGGGGGTVRLLFFAYCEPLRPSHWALFFLICFNDFFVSELKTRDGTSMRVGRLTVSQNHHHHHHHRRRLRLRRAALHPVIRIRTRLKGRRRRRRDVGIGWASSSSSSKVFKRTVWNPANEVQVGLLAASASAAAAAASCWPQQHPPNVFNSPCGFFNFFSF